MNIGLLGYGFMGGAHLAAICGLPEANLIAVASRRRSNANEPVRGNLDLKAGPLPDTVRWHPDWQAIVDDPEIDAVDICLPTHLHKQVILSAFEHGKHVLCEKPLALTAKDCDELLEAASKAERLLMVAQVVRFMFPYRFASGFIRSAGRSVERCTLRRITGYPQWSDWLGKMECSGGAILDLLSHDLDQALWWFGRPEAVSAVSLGEGDTAKATLLYASGFEVTVEGGWLAPELPFSADFEIDAKDASLKFLDGKLLQTLAGQAEKIAIPEQDPYAEEIAYFLACCRRGEAPEFCPPEASAHAVRLAGLVRASREQHGRALAWA